MDGLTLRGKTGERGQNMLEFALILPVLLLLLAGIADLGRLFQSYIVVTNAAQVGARYGSTAPSDTAGIQARAQNATTGTGITLASVVTAYPNGNAPGNPIRVTVTYQFVTLLGSIWGSSSLTLTRAVENVII